MWIGTSVVSSGKTCCHEDDCDITVQCFSKDILLFDFVNWICQMFGFSVPVSPWQRKAILERSQNCCSFKLCIFKCFFFLLCCNNSSLFAKKCISCASLNFNLGFLWGEIFCNGPFVLNVETSVAMIIK